MKFIDKITFLVFLLIWSAEIICQETKSVPPSDLTAILELFNGKKYYQALQNLEIIFRQGNKDHRVLLPLFNCYYYCEEYEKAAGFAESNTEVFSDMQNHLLYAHSLYYLGKLPEAEKAMEKAPRSDLYYQILFSIFETEDRWNNLKYEFHSCRGKLGNSTLQFWLGKITERTALQYNNYMKEQDFNRAAEALREIISLDSRDYYILSLAGLYYAIEDYENARLTAEKITFNKLQSDDEKFTFYKLNGMINCRLGEYEKAAAALTTARKIKCIDYDLEYYTALAYYHLFNYESASLAAADGLKIRQTSDLQYLAGMIAVRQNKFVSAREYLSSYLQAVPEDAEVKNLLGQIASYIEFDRGTEEFRSSNFSAACGHFKNALNYTNPDPVIRLMYANASHMAAREMPDGQEKTNALQTALEQALLAAENEASFAEAGNSIFEIYTALGRFDEARAMLKKIEIKLKNAGSDLLFKMGYSCELQNKYEEALAWYRKSLAKEKKSETLQKCFAMYRQLITLKINRGSYEQALALVSGGIREFGEDLSLRELEIKIGILKNHAMFQQYLFEGETAWHKSNYALAADYYLKAHVIDPDFPGILNSLAACYFHQADFGKSAEYYWKDYTANSVPASFNSYLQAMLKMKRYDDVVQKADEFLSRRGFYSQAHRDAVERSRLEALMQSGATGRAETILTDLVSRNNNYYFLVLLGNIYFEKKEYFKSEEQFKKAIEIDQGGFVPFFNLGVIAAKKGVWNQALEYFSIAEKLRNHPEIIFYYAKIFYHQKEYAWASDNIEKCLALDRNRLDYLWWFCRIRAAQSSYLAEAENRAKVIAGLDRCINESSDREMIFLASKLKVHLLPELILDIRFPVEEQITGTVFAGDIFIFSDTGYGINSINEITGEKLWSIRENAPLSGKMGYNGHLFYALENGTLKFIDIITGREAFKVKTYALDYHAAAEGVYFLDNQKKINLIKKNFQIENIADLGEFQARKIFPAGKNIAVCNDEKILLIDRFSGKQITNLSITPKTAAGSGEQFFYTISGRKLSAFYNTGGKPAARAEFTSDQEVLLHFCSLDEIFICTADKMYIFNIPLQKFREIVLPFAVQNAGRGQDEVIFTGSGRMAKFSCSAEKFLWEKEYSGFKNGFISIISKQ